MLKVVTIPEHKDCNTISDKFAIIYSPLSSIKIRQQLGNVFYRQHNKLWV